MRRLLSYPVIRAGDAEAGGAADLQTDVMRFMAILSLCLVAIFALVQSLPMAPAEPRTETEQVVKSDFAPAPATTRSPVEDSAQPPAPQPAQQTVIVTRPQPVRAAKLSSPVKAPDIRSPLPLPEPSPSPSPTVAPAEAAEPQVGFSLRFRSDAALARLVAMQQVGLYALQPDRTQRMSVRDSRISFWDASKPQEFHEMDPATVPSAVSNALARTGTTPAATRWGVTLPASVSRQIEQLMRDATNGGVLVIESNGTITKELTE